MMSPMVLFSSFFINVAVSGSEPRSPPRRNCLKLSWTNRTVASSSSMVRRHPQQAKDEYTLWKSRAGFQSASPRTTLRASRSSWVVKGRRAAVTSWRIRVWRSAPNSPVFCTRREKVCERSLGRFVSAWRISSSVSAVRKDSIYRTTQRNIPWAPRTRASSISRMSVGSPIVSIPDVMRTASSAWTNAPISGFFSGIAMAT